MVSVILEAQAPNYRFFHFRKTLYSAKKTHNLKSCNSNLLMKRFEADSLRSGEIINLATFLSSNIKHDIRFFILMLWTESKEKILDISYISTSVVKSTFDKLKLIFWQWRAIKLFCCSNRKEYCCVCHKKFQIYCFLISSSSSSPSFCSSSSSLLSSSSPISSVAPNGTFR